MSPTEMGDERLPVQGPFPEWLPSVDEPFGHLWDFDALHMKHAQAGQVIGAVTVADGYDCLHYPHESAASPPKCPSICEVCTSQYRPLHWQQNFEVQKYQEKYSDAEAEEVIKQLLSQTESNLRRIRANILEYGDAVIKRWRKKSVQKRTALLRSIEPNMLKFRTSVADWKELNHGDMPKCKTQLLLPYLNIEHLSDDPMSLIALLHYRAMSQPVDWIMFDSQQLKASFTQGVLEASYNPHCVVLAPYKDKEFGALVPWEKESAHRWSIVGFPRAKLILEAQSRLTGFLASFVATVLHNDIGAAAKGNEVWCSLSATGFGDEGSSAFGIKSLSAAFHAPPTLSLGRIAESLGSRFAAARDESWLLQTDPAFARQLLDSAERASLVASLPEEAKQMMLISMLTRSISRVEVWQQILDDVEYTQKVFDQYHTPGEPIPPECLKALCILDGLLSMYFDYLVGITWKLAFQLGTFNETFKTRDELRKGRKRSFAPLKKQADTSLFTFRALHHHNTLDRDYPEFQLSCLVGQSASFDPNLREGISDLLAINEALMSMKYFRPGYGPILHDAELDAEQDVRVHCADRPHIRYVECNVKKHRAQLWEPLKQFMQTPMVAAKLSRRSIDDFDATHDALGAFWEEYRAVHMELLIKSSCHPDRVIPLMSYTRCGITREYQVMRDIERQQIIAEVERKEAAAVRKPRPFKTVPTQLAQELPPSIQTKWGVDETQSPTTASKKAKVKTRPSPTPQDSDGSQCIQAPDHGTDAAAVPEERIVVSSDTMAILRRMFVSYGKRANSNVRWGNFVAALEECGLVAMSHNGGSMVNFRDLKRGKGSIVLHQPHPITTVNPMLMRTFGKRIERNLEWRFELFVEAPRK